MLYTPWQFDVFVRVSAWSHSWHWLSHTSCVELGLGHAHWGAMVSWSQTVMHGQTDRQSSYTGKNFRSSSYLGSARHAVSIWLVIMTRRLDNVSSGIQRDRQWSTMAYSTWIFCRFVVMRARTTVYSPWAIYHARTMQTWVSEYESITCHITAVAQRFVYKTAWHQYTL